MEAGGAFGCGAMIGAVVGLVTITPAAGFVTPMGALAMGVLGSIGAYAAIRVLSRFRVDDSLDVFACHGVGGIIGSILTGVFATKTVNAGGADGLLYGGGWTLVGVQTVGVLAAAAFAGLVTVVLFVILKRLWVFVQTIPTKRAGLTSVRTVKRLTQPM